MLERMRRGDVDKVLIICPKSLLWSWRDEIWKHGNRKSTVVTGSREEKIVALGRNSRIFIVNYESTIIKDITKKLIDMKFGMIVYDECMDYYQPVTLEDGTTQPIGKLVNRGIKAKVLSYNFRTGKIESKRIVNWFKKRRINNLLKLTINSRKVIRCTNTHKIWTKEGYKLAGELKIGDEVSVSSPSDTKVYWVKIKNIEEITKHRPCDTWVYDIEVEDNHNYFAGNILVSNSTYLKNYQSKRSQVNYIIGRDVNFKMMLTGTPITDSIQDIYSQYKVLDGGVSFGVNYSKFLRYFYYPTQGYKSGSFLRYGSYWAPRKGGAETMWEKLKSSAIRFKKEDCLQLPEKIFVKRYAEFVTGSEQHKDYREVENEIIHELKKSITLEDLLTFEVLPISIPIDTILTKMMKLQQIANGFVYTPDKAAPVYDYPTNPKLEALEEVLDEVLSRGKIVLYTPFRHDKKLISTSRFSKHITLDHQEFVAAPKKTIFVGHPAAAGVGLNLQVSSTLIYYSNHPGIEKRIQTQDRIHRIGQSKKCLYIDLLMKGSSDEDILNKLENKWSRAEAVLRFLRRRVTI